MAALPAQAWNPVAPADQVAGEVTELVAGVGVQPAVAVGDPPRELAEQHAQQHGAHARSRPARPAHCARPGQHRRHREHPGPDDAADDQTRSPTCAPRCAPSSRCEPTWGAPGPRRSQVVRGAGSDLAVWSTLRTEGTQRSPFAASSHRHRGVIVTAVLPSIDITERLLSTGAAVFAPLAALRNTWLLWRPAVRTRWVPWSSPMQTLAPGQ